MPSSDTILAGLRLASGRFIALAIIWHLCVLVSIIALIRGYRPTRRLGATAVALPIVSASAAAFAIGNPFNGSLLGATGAALIVLARRLPPTTAELGSTLARWSGGASIAFAWVYPHFLDGFQPATYLWAAPMGVIPCPTLSLAIGFALLFGGFGGRAWSLVLAAVGLFYGMFGATRLGVTLDLFLVAGALALVVRAFARSGGPNEGAAGTPEARAPSA